MEMSQAMKREDRGLFSLLYAYGLELFKAPLFLEDKPRFLLITTSGTLF